MYSSINPIVRFLFFAYIGTSFAAIPIFVLVFLYKLIVKIKKLLMGEKHEKKCIRCLRFKRN